MTIKRMFSVGFAMFAMLFGAGNVVLPLIIGRKLGSNVWFGTAGFIATAVVVPLIGLIATMLCDGDYKKFLGRVGEFPSKIIIFLCLMLIGPFAFTPRTVTVAHAAVKLYFPGISLFVFSLIAAAAIFVCTYRENKVMDILGQYLGPVQLILLLGVVIKGLFNPSPLAPNLLTPLQGFLDGFLTGYGTGDLLATIFFSGLILMGLKSGMKKGQSLSHKKLAFMGLQSGLVGAISLGLVYAGFCIVAAFYGSQLVGVPDGDIFSVLTRLVLGGVGGVMANTAVVLSCFTTVVALTTVFAEYLHEEIFPGFMSYRFALICTIIASAIVSNLGFSGIMTILMPVTSAIYPALIVLSFVNAAYVFFGFKWVKIPFYATLGITLAMQYGDYFINFVR